MRRPLPARLGLPLWTFLVATMLSFGGSFIQKIAVGWSAWDMTHATSWVAASALADLVPTLILSIPAGAIVDRFRPVPTFWVSQVVSALQAFVLFALAACGHLTLGALIACALVLGACNAFSWPARLACMMQLTPRHSYARVVALYSIGGNAAFFAGPMIAGELLSGFGIASAFAANALAYLPMIGVAMTLPKIETGPIDPAAHDDVLRQIRDGFAYAMRNSEILIMLLSFAAAACTARGIMELAPSIAATALNGDVRTLAHLTSSIAVGALVAGLWMWRGGRWPARMMILVTLPGAALALVFYGALGQIWFALAGAVVLGFVLAVNNISVTSAIQLRSPLNYRGRINALYNMIFKGGPAIGAVIFGWLAQATNVRVSSGVAAMVLALLTLWVVRQAAASPVSELP